MRTPIILAALAGLAATPAHATLIADFELNGSLANSAGTSAVLTNNAGAGSLGATGITFGLNQGPTVSGLGSVPVYTIDMTFTLDSLNGPRGNGYVKLVDFSNLVSDNGFYSHYGAFSIYPLGQSATTVFSAGTPVRLTLSRDAAGNVAGYVDGTLLFSAADPTDTSVTEITGLLTFFTDDYATSQGEASSGFVDYIRIYNTAITPGEATGATPVPEPASWSLMLGVLGLAGLATRGRRFL